MSILQQNVSQRDLGPGTGVIAPKNVLVWPYLVHHWAVQSVMPVMRRRYGTRFTILCQGRNIAEQYRGFMGPDDTAESVPDPKAAEISSEDAVYSLARANETRYGIHYIRDVVQLDRTLFTKASGIAPFSIYARDDAPPLVEIFDRINRWLAWSEQLFDRQSFDLFMGWPMAVPDTCCTYVARRRGLLVTHAYPARLENLALWASGPFIADFQHDEAFQRVGKVGEFDLKTLASPDAPARHSAKRVSDLYSGRRVIRDLARLTLERIHHWVLDLRAGRVPWRARRLKFVDVAAARIRTWRFYREFNKLCVSDLAAITKRPFVFFAFQQEPEFTVQAQSRTFNDQQAIVRQLAKSMPAGVNLVIKEHTLVGYRPPSFYRELVAFPNVIMASPDIPGPKLVQQCVAVASLRGTVTLEAALCGKPALLFGGESEFSMLPNVRMVDSLGRLGDVLDEVVEPPPPAKAAEYRGAGGRIREAIRQISFAGDPMNTLDGTLLDAATAERAADLLVRLNTLFHTRCEAALVAPGEPRQ